MAPLSNTRIVREQYANAQPLTEKNFRAEILKSPTHLAEGDVLLRNLYLGLDPYARFSFYDTGAKVTTLGQPISGFGISQVTESKNAAFPVGTIVTGFNINWEQYTLVEKAATAGLSIIPDVGKSKIALSAYLNVLGINGLTSFAAIKSLVNFKPGQTVYVSSAAGPVGLVLAILAKRAGVFVIGSAGSDEKVDYLKTIKLDAAFNYKTQDTRQKLTEFAPNGLDIYFDIVGGETLDIALEHLKQRGQVVAIGSISTVNGDSDYKIKNLSHIISKALTINGFTAFEHMHRFPDLWAELGPLVASGEIESKETVIKGLELAPQVFVDYLAGKYLGKVVIEVASL